MPGILGRTDASMDSPEWNDFVNAIKGFPPIVACATAPFR